MMIVTNYKTLISGDDYIVELYAGNLLEFYRGIIVMQKKDSLDGYKLDFCNSVDYIKIYNRSFLKKLDIFPVCQNGLYQLIDSDRINEIKKRNYGLSDHLTFFHYLVISNHMVIEFMTQDELAVHLKTFNREVDLWRDGYL